MSVVPDEIELDLMHRQAVQLFHKVAKTPVMGLAKEFYEESIGWVEPDRSETASPACAAISSGAIYSIHLDSPPTLDDESWDGNLEQPMIDVREALTDGGTHGTASASGINGGGAYGSAPSDTVVVDGSGQGFPRRDDVADGHMVDWRKYTAQDTRRVLHFYGYDTKMPKAALIDVLHYLEDVQGYVIEAPSAFWPPNASNF